MTPRRALVAALALLVLAVVLWRVLRLVPTAPPAMPAASAMKPPGPAPAMPAANVPPPPALAEVSHLADGLNAPGGNIHADLKIVDELIGAYRTNFPQLGNPVGDNAEITAALGGKNRLRVALLPPNHPAINRDGELCDRWGTPFFFHAESATKMAIRSAGPDKKMWNADDVLFEP